MNAARHRKIVYLLAIVVLFTGVVGLSRSLEQAAERNNLAQKSLGKVNPVGGVAQLVLLGFRGVAVTFLWQEAIELKKKERWFEIRPVLESITLLQPNFIRPWTFQAWNMSYNIAGEWESVPDKYYWIRQGIDFMKNACAANRDKSDLEWYTGWIYQNRFGMSDEHKYLRELYVQDPDLEYTVSKDGIKDSFMVAFDWFTTANGTVIRTNRRPQQMAITPFTSYPAMARTEYASMMAEEGIFGEKAKDAWRRAYRAWVDFGLMGGTNRETDLMHRLEFSDEEWKQLTDEQKYWADRYANIVKYRYWKSRARWESTSEMQAAREAFYNAEKARKEGDYRLAISEYEKAFPLWRKVLDSDEYLRTDEAFAQDSQNYEAQYMKMLSHLDLPIPKDRPFEGLYPPLPTTPVRRVGPRDLERPPVPEAPPEAPPKK